MDPRTLATCALAALALALQPTPGGAEPGCPSGREGYRDAQGGIPFARISGPRTGTPVCYPERVFRKDGDTAEGVRFVSDDGLAWFTLSRRAGRPLAAALEEAVRDLDRQGATITYRRAVGGWFVLSGHRDDRIYYRKTVQAADGALDTLLIEFPREQKPFYYDIVERMSWSYRPG
jgi:hypothetical protein